MHALWKGALSFGLVHIPVSMHSASMPRELKFKLLHKKDLSQIRYSRICKAEEKEVPWREIVKGYETEKGDYIILTEEDFAKANLKKTRTIEVLDFTDEDQVDTIYYDTPYYLAPQKGAGNAYSLLYNALKTTKKIAIGRFVFHHHEHIGVIRAYENILVLHQLRYHSELKSHAEFPLIHPKVSKTEQEMALKLIKELSKPFNPQKYSDAYTDEVKAIIKKKSKGQKITLKKSRERPHKVDSILSLLKESLEEHTRKKTKRRKAA